MPKIALHWKILIGLALGVVVGIIINTAWTDSTWKSMGVDVPSMYLDGIASPPVPEGLDLDSIPDEDRAAQYPNAAANSIAKAARFIRNANSFIGDLFMRMLKFIAVPIVLFSLIGGVASLNDTAKLGRIGSKTIGIYLVTTAVAITVGLLLANIVGPGNGFPTEIRESLQAAQQSTAEAKIAGASERPSPWSVLLDIVPANPFTAIAEGKMLQVVFASMLIGIGLTMLPRATAKPVVDFCETMTEVVIKIVHIALILAPYAVFALIVKVIADLGIDVLQSLAVYSITVVVGLGIMVFGVYPLVLMLFTKVGYTRFFSAIAPAQLLAFSSASSGATLPVTMESCEERLGVHEEVNSFVIPLGATINMDGTALYQGVAAVFIAQMYGLDLTIMDQLTIVLTATLASIGTAAVPGVGIVMLVIVLQSVGIPLEGIAVILGVDRILDMCRTTCNVTGDCMVCAVVASSENAIDDAETVRRKQAERARLDEYPPVEKEREEAAG